MLKEMLLTSQMGQADPLMEYLLHRGLNHCLGKGPKAAQA